MFFSAPLRLMLRDAAEMCSGFARVATYVSSSFCKEAVEAASLDWAAAGEHMLSAIKATTAMADRYMRSPTRVTVVVLNKMTVGEHRYGSRMYDNVLYRIH